MDWTGSLNQNHEFRGYLQLSKPSNDELVRALTDAFTNGELSPGWRLVVDDL
jgi:hypothetical protein